jgi:hypothetical protein
MPVESLVLRYIVISALFTMFIMAAKVVIFILIRSFMILDFFVAFFLCFMIGPFLLITLSIIICFTTRGLVIIFIIVLAFNIPEASSPKTL